MFPFDKIDRRMGDYDNFRYTRNRYYIQIVKFFLSPLSRSSMVTIYMVRNYFLQRDSQRRREDPAIAAEA